MHCRSECSNMLWQMWRYVACLQGTAGLTLVLAEGLRSCSSQQRQRQQRQQRPGSLLRKRHCVRSVSLDERLAQCKALASWTSEKQLACMTNTPVQGACNLVDVHIYCSLTCLVFAIMWLPAP